MDKQKLQEWGSQNIQERVDSSEDTAIGRQYWHLCSDELPDSIIFKTKDDFIAGMNTIPFALHGLDIELYCFVLMNNHVHFLLSGHLPEIRKFFIRFKNRLGHILKFHHKSPLDGLKPACVLVKDPEMFRTEVAYILRNPLKAGMADPYSYPWSSVRAYFRNAIFPLESKRFGDMTVREMRKSISSRIKFPPDYQVCGGIILPESYICNRKVEKLFQSSVKLFARIKDYNTERDALDMEMYTDTPIYTDSELLEMLQRDFDEYGITGFDDENMKPAVQKALVRKMRYKYSSTVRQIHRISHIHESIIRRYGGWS